jgi:hypothetical protein
MFLGMYNTNAPFIRRFLTILSFDNHCCFDPFVFFSSSFRPSFILAKLVVTCNISRLVLVLRPIIGILRWLLLLLLLLLFLFMEFS